MNEMSIVKDFLRKDIKINVGKISRNKCDMRKFGVKKNFLIIDNFNERVDVNDLL